MANRKQLAILRQGVEVWNKWRKENPEIKVNLSGANLSNADLRHSKHSPIPLSQDRSPRYYNLHGVDFDHANLSRTNLQGAKLHEAWLDSANLSEANLRGADFTDAHLGNANLRRANLAGTRFVGANLPGTNFLGATFRGTDFAHSSLRGADFSNANLISTNFEDADLYHVNFTDVDLSYADFEGAHLIGADLRRANLTKAYLREASLNGANLFGANLEGAHLYGAIINLGFLIRTNLRDAYLEKADLTASILTEANLSGANLKGTDFTKCDLTLANLTNSNLTAAILVETCINKAIMSGSTIYGVNVWDLDGKFKEQKDLIITREDEPKITVDNLKVAQFIYLMLNNEEIREVINTLTSKSVLILGRFSLPERKAILDALRDKLREYDLLPIVFDFDRPTDKDFTETIKTLAGLSYFVIADVTNPKSSPLELQATVPDYQIPFVPIIQEGESPFAMMVDLQKKYNWVLDTISYDSLDTLIEILKPHIIDPAIRKRDQLRLIKAKEPTIISGKELRDKKEQGKL